MERKCVNCGKKYNRVKNERLCAECYFLNLHRRCIECGKVFVDPDNPKSSCRKKCYECEPAFDNTGKKKNSMDIEIKNAKKAGMTYGKYQQWKYVQQCKTNRMIRKLNKDLREE